MSRLIVKGLPKYLTEDRLKDHFSKEGSVTDVKLMKKRNGESRQFAFIGYKSGSDAEKAVRFFDRTYIDTARIEVSLAKTFSDPTVPKAIREKKRLAEHRLAEQEERLLRQKEEQEQYKRQKLDRKSKLDQEIAANPKLLEFIETLKPSSQVQSWKNDSLADGSGAPSAKALEEALAHKDGLTKETGALDGKYSVVPAMEAQSDDEYDDFQKKSGSDDEEMIPFSASHESGSPSGQEAGEAHAEDTQEDSIATNEAVSDLDWLKLRRIRMKENEVETAEAVESLEKAYSDKPSSAQKPARPTVHRPASLSPEETIEAKLRETGRLFIRNILYDSTEDEFRELFSLYGPILEVHIAVDTRTGKSKGFVYVQFQNNEDAVSAFRAMDKQIFQGRLLHILAGEAKKDHKLDEFALKNLPLKKQRELKKKAQASKSQFNWNSLYMNSDAVLDSVASKLGISKAQLIDPQNASSAVKQALAEAHVIGDVRKFFEDRGVDLTTFDQKERDDKVILVKNFPFGTSSDELAELFAEHGPIKRVVMPSSGTIAIVEFRDAPSGRAAFTKLAYRMFKKSILYLEKGPKDLFTREPTSGETVDTEKGDDAVEAKISATDVMADEVHDSEDELLEKGPTVSIFVKNLSFSTTTALLAAFFEKMPGFAVALVKTKPDPKNAGGVLSMGFGFAEFKTKENAEAAIRTLDNTVLEGHRVQLKLSHRKSGLAATSDTASKSDKTNKIIIKNLPFETSRKDVLELFGAYGQVKSVRVPKKFDKSARGFAFVEYTLLKEAESAMNQLKGVHLLGRRLVMQYAEKEATDAEAEIEKMTHKVQKQAASREMAAVRMAGLGKFQLEESEDPFNDF
ncbi:RNA-binding domain-containing protein [Metschnikowia bicuspidata var. bicuspidata NRRL YB-4993]|uniref:Multiple RNA-binding domain-containing protein 1 n=1 Tax=Metschnikowia bicuspidata var. bicuspidata NRRL YB-4993 TaxID=869754 RepID=A0A1A0HFT9_9ASCO|nr:RNA-binding domain-containing protein [Metschnikowia bicuspidata var. bicuspidata NRRL YB-4993]OBA23024.1 RNA-binding domain-containing protein [Metschnikowia bicuspidata var. bicuspidata NRRL YB-4993]